MRIDAAERRRRLAVRHALARPLADPEAVAEAVVALHSTDPASMTLGVLARLTTPRLSEVERALYEDRSLVRILTLRRTVFAVGADRVEEFLTATRRSVAEAERRKLRTMLADSGLDDPEGLLDRAHRTALEAAERLGTFSSADLAEAEPLLATRIAIGAGTKYATHQSLASRLLIVLSAEGHVVRARPAGSWASTNFRWSPMRRWLGRDPRDLDPEIARATVARRWLERFGPATPADLQWWTGWTKGHTMTALATLDTVEVELDEGPGVMLADDLDPTPEVGPWAALLPALDPTPMGWKARDWFLGPHRERVFDAVGNAGPTVWVDGRVVGGWAIRDDATVAFRLFEDVGRHALELVERRAHELETLLDGTVVKARARRWTAVERELRG